MWGMFYYVSPYQGFYSPPKIREIPHFGGLCTSSFQGGYPIKTSVSGLNLPPSITTLDLINRPTFGLCHEADRAFDHLYTSVLLIVEISLISGGRYESTKGGCQNSRDQQGFFCHLTKLNTANI